MLGVVLPLADDIINASRSKEIFVESQVKPSLPKLETRLVDEYLAVLGL